MSYPLNALEGVASKGIEENMAFTILNATRQNHYTALLLQNLCWQRSLPLWPYLHLICSASAPSAPAAEAWMVFLLTLIGLDDGAGGWWAGFFVLHQATLMLALNGKKANRWKLIWWSFSSIIIIDDSP